MKSKTNIRININDRIKKAIIEDIKLTSIPRIERSVITNVKESIIDAMLSVLKNDPIYKGIQGKYIAHKKDLQAQFGLTSELAEESTHIIDKIFSQSIRIQRRKDRYGIEIIGDRDQIESELLSNQVFSYYSYNLEGNDTGHFIPWMQWILNKSGEANGFISFDATNVSEGRSERAIMIPTPGIHWTVGNNVDLGNGNFIDRILNSPQFIERASAIISQEYLRQVNG